MKLMIYLRARGSSSPSSLGEISVRQTKGSGFATLLQILHDQVKLNLPNYGNTSAASIPLALDEAVRSRKEKAGHTIATARFGAGLTWGSAIVRWG